MSILLDALKKSEEQRQQGSAPNRDSSAASPSARRSAVRKRLLLALLAVAVVMAAWIGWRQFREPDNAPGSSAAAASQPSAVPLAGQAEAAAPAQSVESVTQRTPVETFAPDGESGQGEDADSASEPAPAALEKTQVNQSFTDFEAPPQTASAAQQAPLKTGSPGVAETAAPKAAGKPAPPARSPANATEPITFWELPQGIRDSLPDLRITVLVFAERPEDRFVLIGGQRRMESDRLQDGLVLEEIRRDGAVFTFRNYRFLVQG